MSNVRNWVGGALAFVTLTSVAMFASEYVYGRQTLTVTVLEVDIPRTCYKSRSLLFGRAAYRSSVPKSGAWDYCGLLITDHGSIALPQSGRWGWPSAREDMFDILCVGGRFEVTASGPGVELALGAFASNHPKSLVYVKRVGACPTLAVQDKT